MSQIQLGADQLQRLPVGTSARIGLVTNATGFTSEGLPTWKALAAAGYNLAALFGPEHGFRGEAQDAVHVTDAEFQGVPVYSLYGTRERPTREMLENLDMVVYDIQDVGCRYYTYIYTLAYMMEACAEWGIPLTVLDRPNPIGNRTVEGNPMDPQYDNFVGGYGLAPRYGMTAGEMASYLRGEYFPTLELTVLWMKDYNPESCFDELPLPWPLPSPNLPGINTALLYPGTCLVEGTNLSEGRGTTRPFEVIGAPWLDGEVLRERLSDYHLPGIRFSSIFFTPTISKFRDELCEGVLIHIVDRKAVNSLRTGLVVMTEAAKMNRDRFDWRPLWENEKLHFIDQLTGGPDYRNMMDEGVSGDEIFKAMTVNQKSFETIRSQYLHY